MKHHDPSRPIGKCKGCCLNARTRCEAGLLPKNLWSRGRCRHFGNAELLAEIRAQPEPAGARRARRARQARAALAATEPHYNGLLHAKGPAGTARRR